jgi:hypothetical protein
MDSEERDLFAKSLGHATARHTGAALDAALDELGWADAHGADPRVAVATLFELQGSSGATSSALDHVLATALGQEAGAVSVVLPPLGGGDPPGRVEAGSVTVAGLGTAPLAGRDGAVVVAGAGDGWAAAVVSPEDLTLRTVHGMDPGLGLVEVTGTAAWPDASPVAWPDAVAAGQRALAHELVGASRAMLELARAHALERVQFDRPIASFQAVRHRLADSLVAVEAADGALAAAWEDPSLFAAGLAKALAGRGARTVARHSQQVLAGIGFTTDHPFHRFLKRALALEGLFGSADDIVVGIGRQLIAERTVPTLIEL